MILHIEFWLQDRPRIGSNQANKSKFRRADRHQVHHQQVQRQRQQQWQHQCLYQVSARISTDFQKIRRNFEGLTATSVQTPGTRKTEFRPIFNKIRRNSQESNQNQARTESGQNSIRPGTVSGQDRIRPESSQNRTGPVQARTKLESKQYQWESSQNRIRFRPELSQNRIRIRPESSRSRISNKS